jgi:hypothetical protein
MKNTSKYFGWAVAIFVSSFSTVGFAGDLIVFNDPNLIAMHSSGKIFGYYGAEDDRTSCAFFFSQKSGVDAFPQKGADAVIDISTFVLPGKNYDYDHRDKDFDISGKIFVKNGKWVIQTAENQAGCDNATGVFKFGPDEQDAVHYTVAQSSPALGIRVVEKKTFFNNRDQRSFVPRSGFLVGGNVVAVTETDRDFSYVRFTNPSTGKTTKGWVKTGDLGNPFPASPQ